MVKTLESAPLEDILGLDKASSYKIRSVGNKYTHENHLSNKKGIELYLCDCDGWGGGDSPCDNCR